MPTVDHVDLTGTDLHEPKGVAAATADQVYVSDGLGSGAWTDLGILGDTQLTNSAADVLELDGSDTFKLADGKLMLGSTAVTSTAAELNVLDGIAVGLTAAELSVLDGITATTTELNQYALTIDIDNIVSAASYYIVAPFAGAIKKIWSVIDSGFTVSDVVITASIAGVGVTNGTITITQAGSAAGDVDFATPTALNTLTAGQALKLAFTGGTTATLGHLVVVIER